MHRLKGIFLTFSIIFIILDIIILKYIDRFTHTWIGYVLFSVCLGIALCLGIFHYILLIKKFDLTIVGPVNTADGVGGQGINQYRLLKKLAKINIKATSFKSKDLSLEESFWARLPVFKFGKVIFFHDYNSHKSHKPCLSVLFNLKNRFRKRFKLPNPKKHLIFIYSMIESTALPDYMVNYMNTCFDAVIVPDPFLIELYKNAGVKKPIFCLPLIVNYRMNAQHPLKQKASEVFTFSNLSSTYDRKNTAKLVDAFLLAFKNIDNVRLAINSRAACGHELVKIKNSLANAPEKERAKVCYTNDVLDEKQFENALNACDCYVSPSKGEGFSIIPREAMILGIPCIVTDNTGQSTIAQSGLAEVVKSEIICPALYEYKDKTLIIGNHFDCKVEDLAQAMMNVYKNYSSYLKKSQQMREWAFQYSFDKLRPLHYRFLINPKRIILGEKNELTEECITTDSAEFYEKYKNIFKL